MSATGCARTFFTSTRTAGGKSLFQTERMAELFIDVLRSQMRTQRMIVHEFVVMPNHVHISMTLPGDMSLEKAMQLIKGGFSFRANKELGFRSEIWQRGFSDVRIVDEESFQRHRAYIENNSVKAGLANSPEEYKSGSAYLKIQKRAAKRSAGKIGILGEIGGERPSGAEAHAESAAQAARLESCPDRRLSRISPGGSFFAASKSPALNTSSRRD